MRRCRTSCSNRFRSLTMASSFKHSMHCSSRTPIHSIGNCRRWSSCRKRRQQFSRWIKRCFLVYLRQWMKDNAILPADQSGFREHHSTTTRFVQFLQHLSAGLLQQTASLVIYMDFTKAFDQLWHDGLLYKLHRMNCPQELVIFIIEYLKNRKCYIEMNKVTSAIFDIEKGVPQGSCLGPILFLLFHCEMAQRIPAATHAHLFADDLALIVNASPWWHRSEFASQMQRNRSESIEWSPSLLRWVETADQFPQDRLAMDASTSSHSNPLSLDRSTSHQENSRVQIPWLSRWWTSLIQWTLHEDAPKSPKELCYPQIRHSIKNIISKSEKTHLSSVHSTLSANGLRGLADVITQFNRKNSSEKSAVVSCHSQLVGCNQWRSALATKLQDSRIESTTLPPAIHR